MKRIFGAAHARAGLVGNPSDGYFGKTISFVVRNFAARVVVYEWPEIEILPSKADQVRFANLDELAEDVGCNGYYGALRLVTAAVKKFRDYCHEKQLELPAQNFSLRYETNIPRGVGLAGSSAIITATFRALMAFYNVQIPQPELPNWILATERDELRIQAGLQDRVAQVYEGLTYMDFSRDKMETDGFGEYQSLDPLLLPPLYIAYRTELAEPSDVVHNDLRARFDAGDPAVHAAMRQFADLTERARAAILARDLVDLAHCINKNFDLRAQIMPIASAHLKMIETARKCGASAHFAGSGGTIAGTYQDETTFAALQSALGNLGCRVLQPQIRNFNLPIAPHFCKMP